MVDTKNEDGVQAFNIAAEFRSLSRIKVLLKHGADVNVTDNDLSSALRFAAIHANLSLAKLLLANGAAVSPKDKFGR